MSTTRRAGTRDILRALAWKEWREQSALVAIGAGISIALPAIVLAMASAAGGWVDIIDLADTNRFLVVVLVWPLLAAAVGAATNPAELAGSTGGFLYSRPASRLGIWATKVGLGAVSLLAIVVVSLFAARLFDWLAVGPQLTFSLSATPLQGSEGFVRASAAACLLLIFAFSVYFATWFERTLTAAGSGIVAGLAIFSLIYLFWSGFGPFSGPGGAQIALIESGIATAAILAASWYALRRGETLQRTAVARRSVAIAGLALVLLVPSTATLAFWKTRVTLTNMTLSSPTLSPGGDLIVLYADNGYEPSRQIWTLDLDSNLAPLTRVGAGYSRTFSADGTWIAYVRDRDWFGFPGRGELRIVRRDGTGDRRLAPVGGRSPYGPLGAFSPDGTRFARLTRTYTSGRRAYWVEIIDIEGDGIMRVELDGRLGSDRRQRSASPSTLDWTADGSRLLMGSSQMLAVLEVDSGELQPVYEPEQPDPSRRQGYRSLSWPRLRQRNQPRWPAGAPPRVPVFSTEYVRGRDDYGRLRWLVASDSLELVDPRTGAVERITESTCDAAELTPDGERLAYGVCEGSRQEADQRAELRVRELGSGEERVLTTLPGSISSVYFSPDASRLLVYASLRVKSGDWIVAERTLFAVDLDGTVHDLERYRTYDILGWSGSNHLIVSNPTRGWRDGAYALGIYRIQIDPEWPVGENIWPPMRFGETDDVGAAGRGSTEASGS